MLTLSARGQLVRRALVVGQPVEVGRGDLVVLSERDAALSKTVSARSAEVVLVRGVADGLLEARLTSLGANGLLLRSSAPAPTHLRRGEFCTLREGDTAALCVEDEALLQVSFAWEGVAREAPPAAEEAPVEEQEPPAKRARAPPEESVIDLTNTTDEDEPAPLPATRRPLLLLLGGLPGSGKSTFAEELMQRSPSFRTVCQDTVRNGKGGTKAHVARATLAHLRAGSHTIVDRTNLSADTRCFLVGLARLLRIPLHCVYLDTPRQTCQARILLREGHQVMGPEGVKVLALMAGKKDSSLPSRAEGFDSVAVARTAPEVKALLERFSALPAAREGVAAWQEPSADTHLETALNKEGAKAEGGAAAAAGNAFSALRAGAASAAAGPAAPPARPKPASGGGGWGNALADFANDPSSPLVLHADTHCIAIADLYPKARYHHLVIARDRRLDSWKDLAAGDAPLLAHMRTVAAAQVAAARAADPSLRGVPIRLGFHAEPSMRRLHLHVISFDLVSVKLTKKVHFNSYTTPFFLALKDVEAALRSPAGRLSVDLDSIETWKTAPLRCHRCGAAFPFVPALKQHIEQCTAPLPRDGDWL